jgi:hypothetical protein
MRSVHLKARGRPDGLEAHAFAWTNGLSLSFELAPNEEMADGKKFVDPEDAAA